MRLWQYKKIALNEAPRKRDDVDLLCDAGDEGWELVAVLPTGVAYLKRELQVAAAEGKELAMREEPSTGAPPEERSTRQEGKAKYRDPVTGETWSGRGRMASWLKRKQDAGEDIENYRVEGGGSVP